MIQAANMPLWPTSTWCSFYHTTRCCYIAANHWFLFVLSSQNLSAFNFHAVLSFKKFILYDVLPLEKLWITHFMWLVKNYKPTKELKRENKAKKFTHHSKTFYPLSLSKFGIKWISFLRTGQKFIQQKDHLLVSRSNLSHDSLMPIINNTETFILREY